MDARTFLLRARAAPLLLLAWPVVAIAQSGNLQTLPVIEVTATPTGTRLDPAQWPGATSHLDAADFKRQQSPNVVDAMLSNIPALAVGNATGNPFEPDVRYHGFVATPLTGTPEGLAVYQNGVRINEAFGDNVHWDFIPPDAIRSLDVLGSNPLYGLNTLGGAVDVRMKDGFGYRGMQDDVEAGSYGRLGEAIQLGGSNDALAGYLAADVVRDDGFRESSGSLLRRMYGDVGYRSGDTELHMNLTAASNRFEAPGTTPAGLLARSRDAVFTTPQSDRLKMWMLDLQGSTRVGGAWKLAGNAYFRHLADAHRDGNDTDVQRCEAPAQAWLCFGGDGAPAHAADGSGQLPDIFAPADVIGEIDGNRTRTRGWGASVQLSNSAHWGGLRNRFVAGASFDAARTDFSAAAELGVVDPATFVVTGNGQWLGRSTSDAGSIGPVRLRGGNAYLGVYALDTLQIGKRLAVTAGGRFNRARIDLDDRLDAGPGSLTGRHDYTRFNPMAGATYRIAHGVTAYAGWSRSSRTPTPLELGCSDPDFPCTVDAFLVADPPLAQVSSRTLDAGLRGNVRATGNRDGLHWRLGLFSTLTSNDILDVAAPLGKSFGYFANVGATRRQGIDASIRYTAGKWSWHAGGEWLSATYQSHLRLNPPEGDPAGDAAPLDVEPGDRISGIPARQFKAGVEYRPNPDWTVGVDARAVGAQYFAGDESNQNPRLPGYTVADLRVAWRVSRQVRLHAQVLNLFDRHYSVYGTYYDTGSPIGALVGSTDPRSLMPGMPRAFYVGLEIAR